MLKRKRKYLQLLLYTVCFNSILIFTIFEINQLRSITTSCNYYVEYESKMIYTSVLPQLRCEIPIGIHTHGTVLYGVSYQPCPFLQMQIPGRKGIQLTQDGLEMKLNIKYVLLQPHREGYRLMNKMEKKLQTEVNFVDLQLTRPIAKDTKLTTQNVFERDY